MSNVDTELSLAWREAALRLGIRVLAPHDLQLPGGGVVTVEAFLPDFGGPSGMVVVAMADEARWLLASAVAPAISQLSSDYRVFDDQFFQETLNDWSWFAGALPAPPWYRGRPCG